ncbi:MAG TPA: glycine zipper domain-containing protein [Candidatus Limnocylindrales bacterium]|nr:glycine zipper domain-containing protein [Candidatus Limnocylindrales bacterium]
MSSRGSLVVFATTMALGIAVAGCASGPMTRREEGLAAGAIVGAGSGAVIGAAAGDPAAGAIIGGALGAITGAAIGDAQQAREQEAYYLEQRAREQEYELARQRAEIERLRRERGEPGYRDPYEPPYSQPHGYYSERYYESRHNDDGDYYEY